MKTVLFSAVLALVFNVVSVFGNDQTLLTAKDELVSDDFKLVGLELAQPLSKITQVLGKPQKIIKTKQVISFCYPNIVVQSFPVQGYKNTIDKFILIDKTLKTFRGIGIGDKEENVFYRYGQKDKTDNSLTYETYLADGLDHAICFTINEGRVKNIEIYIAED